MSELGQFVHELAEACHHLRKAQKVLQYEWDDANNDEWLPGKIALALMRQVLWLVNRIRRVLADDIAEAQYMDRLDHLRGKYE
jgi:predicted metal-dependent hydrolase